MRRYKWGKNAPKLARTLCAPTSYCWARWSINAEFSAIFVISRILLDFLQFACCNICVLYFVCVHYCINSPLARPPSSSFSVSVLENEHTYRETDKLSFSCAYSPFDMPKRKNAPLSFVYCRKNYTLYSLKGIFALENHCTHIQFQYQI